MLNTIIFFLASLFTYFQFNLWFNDKDTKGEMSGILAVICWTLLYLNTNN